MDALITAGARALALGDPLRALNHVALRNDPPALALRGIAMGVENLLAELPLTAPPKAKPVDSWWRR